MQRYILGAYRCLFVTLFVCVLALGMNYTWFIESNARLGELGARGGGWGLDNGIGNSSRGGFVGRKSRKRCAKVSKVLFIGLLIGFDDDHLSNRIMYMHDLIPRVIF